MKMTNVKRVYEKLDTWQPIGNILPGDYDIYIGNLSECARLKGGRYEVIDTPRIYIYDKSEKEVIMTWYVSYQYGIKIEFLDGRKVEFYTDGRLGDDPAELSRLVNFIEFGDNNPTPGLETFDEDDLLDI